MSAMVERTIEAPPSQVYRVLGDGWQYAGWVVGATHIRDVDKTWPAAGTRLYHRVGIWPMTIKDHTEVLESEQDSLLVLRARAWPMGEARVRMELSGQSGGTRVVMRESAARGPGRFIPPVLINWLLRARNRESLARLASIVENKQG